MAEPDKNNHTKNFYNDLPKKANKKSKYVSYIIVIGTCIFLMIPTIRELRGLSEFEPKVIIDIIFYYKDIFWVIFFLILFIFLRKIYPKICPLLLKNIHKECYNTNKIIAELNEYYISKDIIKMKSESGEINLIKEKIYKIKTDEDSIYIYIGVNMAYIIKKR